MITNAGDAIITNAQIASDRFNIFFTEVTEDLISLHIADRYFFLYIYHKSLIQSKVMFFLNPARRTKLKNAPSIV
jgi:hypothetical protein